MSNKNDSYYLWTLFCSMILVASCQNSNPNDWQKYYLSPKLNNEKLVYAYSGTINDKATIRYVLHSLNQDTIRHIYYSSTGIKEQEIIEITLQDGARMSSYTLFENDSPITATIDKADVFSFIPLRTNEYLQSEIQWVSPIDSSINKVVKLRKFVKDSTIMFNEKELPILVFDTHEQITNTMGNTFEYEARGQEIYGLGYGLIREVKHIENAYRLNFELKSILSTHELDFKTE